MTFFSKLHPLHQKEASLPQEMPEQERDWVRVVDVGNENEGGDVDNEDGDDENEDGGGENEDGDGVALAIFSLIIGKIFLFFVGVGVVIWDAEKSVDLFMGMLDIGIFSSTSLLLSWELSLIWSNFSNSFPVEPITLWSPTALPRISALIALQEEWRCSTISVVSDVDVMDNLNWLHA